MTKREPAAITATVAMILNVLVLTLSLDLSGDQQTAIVAAITAIAGLFIRSKVTPVA